MGHRSLLGIHSLEALPAFVPSAPLSATSHLPILQQRRLRSVGAARPAYTAACALLASTR